MTGRAGPDWAALRAVFAAPAASAPAAPHEPAGGPEIGPDGSPWALDEELAAILEFDEGLSRAEAERRARAAWARRQETPPGL